MDIAVLENQFCGCSQALLYNSKRPHQSLDGATPDQAYFTMLRLRVAAQSTPADVPLIDAETLFKESEPLLRALARRRLTLANSKLHLSTIGYQVQNRGGVRSRYVCMFTCG